MLANFVQQQTTTSGTGTIELVEVTGRKTFVEAFGSGARVRYAIVNADGTQREIGYGTVTDAAPDTLTREQIVESTNNDALVNFGAGAKNVYVAGGDVELLKFGGAVPLQVAGGTRNARTLTHVPPVKAVVAGMEFEFINGNEANDAAATLTVDTDFEFTILRPDGSALQPGDMPASRILRVRVVDADEAWLTDLPGQVVDLDATVIKQGRHTIWVPAGAMVARTTNGAAPGTVETTTNKIMLKTLDFDKDTIEYAQFAIRMPKGWNEGTVSAVFEWSHASTTTNFKVSWGLQAVAISDDDALDAAFGTAQYANDTGGTTNDAYASPETAAITIAGTPAAEDLVIFQVLRKADDGTNDTLGIDARLHGLTLYYTVNAPTDA